MKMDALFVFSKQCGLVLILCGFLSSCAGPQHGHEVDNDGKDLVVGNTCETARGFDASEPNTIWRTGDAVVYRLQLDEGKKRTTWDALISVQSTKPLDKKLQGNLTVKKKNKTVTHMLSSPLLPGQLVLTCNGKNPSSTETQFPQEFLEVGLKSCCDSNDQGAMGRGLFTLMFFVQLMQKDATVSPILYKVTSRPNLWSVITQGININIEPCFDEKEAYKVRLGDLEYAAYRFPLKVTVNGKPALDSYLTVISPENPFHTCGGIVRLEATHLKKKDTRFRMDLVSARRGNEDLSFSESALNESP